MAPLDEAASLVLRTQQSDPPECALAVSIGAFGFGGMSSTITAGKSFAVGAPWSDMKPTATLVDTAALGTPAPSIVQRTTTGLADLFVETVAPDGVAVYHFSSGKVFPRSASVEYPDGVPEGAVGVGFVKPTITLVKPDGSWLDLTTAEAGKSIGWVAVDHSGGDAIVWTEAIKSSATGSFGDVTVWTSPHTTDAAGISRRKVAVVRDGTGSGGSGAVVNAGMMLIQKSSDSATLTRLSDGMGWSIKVDPGQVVVGAVWVDDWEVIVGTKPVGVPGPPTSLQRLRRDTLGAPTISSGT